MVAHILEAEQDAAPTLSDLVRVYLVLSNALSIIRDAHDQALIGSQLEGEERGVSGQERLLETEELVMEKRVAAIKDAIRLSEPKSKADSIAQMKYEILTMSEPNSKADEITSISEVPPRKKSSRIH